MNDTEMVGRIMWYEMGYYDILLKQIIYAYLCFVSLSLSNKR